jgi:hypothetical protein
MQGLQAYLFAAFTKYKKNIEIYIINLIFSFIHEIGYQGNLDCSYTFYTEHFL